MALGKCGWQDGRRFLAPPKRGGLRRPVQPVAGRRFGPLPPIRASGCWEA